MKRQRKRSPKPTDGPADLLFSKQRALRKFRGNETLTRPELRVWRTQQKVAKRLRRLRKRLMRWQQLIGAPSASISLVASQGLAARFVVGSVLEEAADITVGAIVGREGEGLRSSVLRRALQVARSTVLQLGTAPVALFESMVGQRCLICSGPHGVHRCLQVARIEWSREEEHAVIASHRLALEADELVRMEESMRIARARVRQDLILRRRFKGLFVLGWCIAKQMPMNALWGPIRAISSISSLVDDAWYIGTGQRLLEVPRPSQAFNRLWGSKMLLDLAEELRKRDDPPPEVVLPEPEPQPVASPPPPSRQVRLEIARRAFVKLEELDLGLLCQGVLIRLDNSMPFIPVHQLYFAGELEEAQYLVDSIREAGFRLVFDYLPSADHRIPVGQLGPRDCDTIELLLMEDYTELSRFSVSVTRFGKRVRGFALSLPTD